MSVGRISMAVAVVGALPRSLSTRGGRGIFSGSWRHLVSMAVVALGSESWAFLRIVEEIEVLEAIFG